ncbi:class D beta-lactamase [Sinorhizobium sp. BG8]|uniref:class D beta-lactamase n=1 Tax=Sinorhizobium sp. BG8 TaxID=2613773 RepID=UPI00193E1C2D|nr:class D beta-lactamase [Sinorhizobium sp. BG8]QRM56274.1 class D beta-lactamase [Sinorhizobium sp. BG8]
MIRAISLGVMLVGLAASVSQAKTICTVIADAATGDVVFKQGNCEGRYTPASTFKIPLSVMGYDSGFLKDAHNPTLPFKKGYAEWGGENWRQPTDAVRWLKYSVVWFSQQIAAFLGEDKLHEYARQFGYGNADFSGDPGKNNGLERAWIASSLKISPLEQVAFLRRLVNRQLPVRDHAVDETMKVVEGKKLENGWFVQGKTGMAYPRNADYSFDYNHPWGWYIGWAVKDDRTYVFARLTQEEKRTEGSAGGRARDALFREFPSLLPTD